MGRGYVGSDLSAYLDVSYEYQGHVKNEPDDILNNLQMNMSFAENTDNYKTNVKHIMDQAVEYAKSFLEQNGTYDTGKLYSSIEAKRVTDSSWTLHAPAMDEKSHYYSGHIEYGFTDKAGRAHGPWPFLRPAVKLAAMDSRGELEEALAYNLLYGEINNDYGTLKFGRSGNYHSYSKAGKSFTQLSEGYRRWDSKTNSMREWGGARNGFNDYRGFFERGTTSNQYTTGTNEQWDFGEL